MPPKNQRKYDIEEERRRIAVENDALVNKHGYDMERLLSGEGYRVHTRPTVMIDRDHGIVHFIINCTRSLEAPRED